MIEITRDFLGSSVTLSAERLGRDIALSIYGGDGPHIGAVAVAVPYRKGERLSVSTSILCVPGHKEGDLARSVAEDVAKRHEVIVSVTCGIHYEGIAREAIPKLCALVMEMAACV